MKILSTLFGTLLILLPQLVLAGDYYITTNDTNVRTGEGIEYPVSFTIPEGEEVEVVSKNNSYYQIRYSGKTGYVYSGYLHYSGSKKRFRWTASLLLCIGLILCVVLPRAYVVFRRIKRKRLLETVTKSTRGTKTEHDLVLKLLDAGIPGHHIFHDLYLINTNNNFSQIDVVVITSVGIIVVEVKKLSGWIFGNGNQSHWTQLLADGKQQYRLYNPILQNNTHVAALKKQLLPFGNIPFYSMIVVYGDCVLKEINYVPAGTFLVKENRALEVINIILKENAKVHYDEAAIFSVLKEAFANGSSEDIQRQHRERIKEMIGKHRIFD